MKFFFFVSKEYKHAQVDVIHSDGEIEYVFFCEHVKWKYDMIDDQIRKEKVVLDTLIHCRMTGSHVCLN